jgi:hypothetical protein
MVAPLRITPSTISPSESHSESGALRRQDFNAIAVLNPSHQRYGQVILTCHSLKTGSASTYISSDQRINDVNIFASALMFGDQVLLYETMLQAYLCTKALPTPPPAPYSA